MLTSKRANVYKEVRNGQVLRWMFCGALLDRRRITGKCVSGLKGKKKLLIDVQGWRQE